MNHQQQNKREVKIISSWICFSCWLICFSCYSAVPETKANKVHECRQSHSVGGRPEQPILPPQTSTHSRCLSSRAWLGWPKAANPLLVYSSLPAPVQWALLENFTYAAIVIMVERLKKYPICYHWGSNYSIFWTWFASWNDCQLSGTVPWDKFEPTSSSKKRSYAWSETAQLYNCSEGRLLHMWCARQECHFCLYPRILPRHTGSRLSCSSNPSCRLMDCDFSRIGYRRAVAPGHLPVKPTRPLYSPWPRPDINTICVGNFIPLLVLPEITILAVIYLKLASVIHNTKGNILESINISC